MSIVTRRWIAYDTNRRQAGIEPTLEVECVPGDRGWVPIGTSTFLVRVPGNPPFDMLRERLLKRYVQRKDVGKPIAVTAPTNDPPAA